MRAHQMPQSPRLLIQAPRLLVASVALAVLQTSLPARAATTDNWTAAGSGNWSLNTNWTNTGSTHTVPAAGDTVNILETDGVSRTITYDYTGSAVTLGNLSLDLTGGAAGANTTLSMAANTLTANIEYVGNSGAGSNGTAFFSQSGGSNNATNLTLAQNASDAGYYTQSGGNLSVGSGWEVIGYSGTGIFTQTGGNNTSSQLLEIGYNPSSNGTVNLSNTGLITVGNNLYVGLNGKGALNQTGGTLNVATGIGIAALPGSTGNYTLSAGTATAPSVFVGGYFGASGSNGFLNISGGNLTASSTLKIWNPNCMVNFSGGNLSVGTLDTSSAGPTNFNWTAGNLTITNSGLIIGSNGGVPAPLGNSLALPYGKNLVAQQGETVAYTAIGSVTQSGGNNSAAGMDIAEQPGSSGNYTLSSGSLSLTNNSIWGYFGNATFTQTGGQVSATKIDLGEIAGYGNGTITINQDGFGSESFNATQIYVGGSNSGAAGNGTLNILQGSVTISSLLSVWNTGTVNLSGGFLSVNSLNTNGNPANFHWTGGELYISGLGFTIDSNGPLGASLTLNSGMTLGASSAGINNKGAITFNGGIITSSGVLTNNSSITGFGAINGYGFVNNAYLAQSGGSLAISASTVDNNAGTIALSTVGQFQISGTTLINTGTINLNSSVIAGTAALNNLGGTIVGPGTILVSLTNTGTLIAPAGTTNLNAALTNAGVISLAGLGANLNAPSITNTGTLQGAGAINAAINNTTGTIESSGGTLIFSNVLNNSGTLAVDNASKLLVATGLAINSGIISLTGGTFDNGGYALTNNGQISGYGILRTGGGGLTNNGTFILSGSNGATTTVNGNVTNLAGKTINIEYNPAIFTGNINNSGTIKTTSTTVTFTGTYTGNNYISDPATNIFQQSATTIPGGLMTGGPGDVFSFNTFTNNGTFQNGGNLAVSTSITNNGTFSQTGPQTWSKGATFTNASGNATFGSNAKLYGLTISAGTVDITTSHFIIEATDATKSTTLATLQQNIGAHALTSSNIPANYALALIDNSITNLTSFGGNPADSNSLLLAPELLGDTNIDGKVDATDLNTVLTHFGQSTAAWTSGNFGNATTIDLTDLAYVLNNFGLTNPNASSATIPTSTPEPTSLLLLLAPAVWSSAFTGFRARRSRTCAKYKKGPCLQLSGCRQERSEAWTVTSTLNSGGDYPLPSIANTSA